MIETDADSPGAGTAEEQAGRSPLARLLCPSTIAFVGLSDNSHFRRTVQPTLDSDAGIFMVNPRYDTVLGRPTVGLGGIFVEVLNRVGGRMVPFTAEVARDLIEEFADLKVMHGFRGRPGWDLDALTGILVAAGQLAARGRDWIATLDINPLIYGPDGFAAVDALLLIGDPRR
jgi:ATP-grasp domain